MNNLKNILLFSLILLSFGCVEHLITFHVQPSGQYNVSIYSHGDRQDLLDNDFCLPTSENWDIKSNFDSPDVETFDYNAKRSFSNNFDFPSTFYNGDSIFNASLLQTPTHVTTRNWFFWKTFIFSAQFQDRNVLQKYPKVLEFLQNSDNASNGWLKESLQYILKETIDRSQIEFNTKPIIAGDLDKWFSENIATLPDSILFVDIDFYTSQGLDLIMQPNSPSLYPEMDSIFQMLKYELDITLDLADDDFTYQVILPGLLVSHNADTVKHDTLEWNFNLMDFASSNYEMNAQSEISYPNRQTVGWVFFVLSIGGFLFWKRQWKKKLN
jgi:hypothetical protein